MWLEHPSQRRPMGSEPGEAMLMMDTCGACGGPVLCHPDLVPTMPVDPQTGRPPDVDEHAQPCEPDPEAVARSVLRPLCRTCVDAANRVRPGTVTVLPGAYPGEG